MKTPYETMFLLPPTMAEDKIDEFLGRLRESIEKKHGEVTAAEKMGVRKTAYVVNKLNAAYYVLLQYRGRGETIQEVERMLRNSDEVLKYLSTKITTKPAPVVERRPRPEPAAAPAVASEPAAVVDVNPTESGATSASQE
ncbi:MAG: 30S ribosomal protein S6 [candidate division FCPU426 bacterium]